jgi:hypothetical protein
MAGHVVFEVVPAGGGWDLAERRHIKKWNEWQDLENIRSGGNGGSGGYKFSPETIAKRIGKKRSPEHRAAISAALRGKPSPRKGRPISADHRDAISAGLRGKPKSAEHRAAMSEAAKRTWAKKKAEG